MTKKLRPLSIIPKTCKRLCKWKRNKIESDIVLVAFDLNKNIKLSENKLVFQKYLNNQRVLRNLDQLHLINSKKELIMTAEGTEYIPIDDRAIEMVLEDDRPQK